MTKTVEILLAASEIVATGWTQEAYARSANGASVDATSKEATCWCALGAIEKACNVVFGPEYEVEAFYKARDSLSAYLETHTVSRFNDSPLTTQDKVVNAFKTAAYWELDKCRSF